MTKDKFIIRPYFSWLKLKIKLSKNIFKYHKVDILSFTRDFFARQSWHFVIFSSDFVANISSSSRTWNVLLLPTGA